MSNIHAGRAVTLYAGSHNDTLELWFENRLLLDDGLIGGFGQHDYRHRSRITRARTCL